MTPNFVVVFNVFIPLCRHMRSGSPNLPIFVEEIVMLLGAMTDKWVCKLFYGRN